MKWWANKKTKWEKMRRGSEKRNFLRALKAYWFERINFLLLRERMAFYFLIFRSTNISIMRVKGVKCQGYETSIIFTLNLLEISLKKSFKGKKLFGHAACSPLKLLSSKIMSRWWWWWWWGWNCEKWNVYIELMMMRAHSWHG